MEIQSDELENFLLLEKLFDRGVPEQNKSH